MYVTLLHRNKHVFVWITTQSLLFPLTDCGMLQFYVLTFPDCSCFFCTACQELCVCSHADLLNCTYTLVGMTLLLCLGLAITACELHVSLSHPIKTCNGYSTWISTKVRWLLVSGLYSEIWQCRCSISTMLLVIVGCSVVTVVSTHHRTIIHNGNLFFDVYCTSKWVSGTGCWISFFPVVAWVYLT